MLDLETLSTRPNSCILTIGAVKFNRDNILHPLEKLEQYYCRIELDSCKKLNMHIDPNTQSWWEKQDQKAQYEVFHNTDRIDLKVALTELKDFYKGSKYVWANGDDFDCVIIGEAYRLCNIEVPWKFWSTRDCRTIMDIGKVWIKDTPNNNPHNALYDCYHQIQCVKQSLVKLGLA